MPNNHYEIGNPSNTLAVRVDFGVHLALDELRGLEYADASFFGSVLKIKIARPQSHQSERIAQRGLLRRERRNSYPPENPRVAYMKLCSILA